MSQQPPGSGGGALGRFDLALKVIAALFVVMLLTTVTAGIVMRAFNKPLSWTEEASGFLMVWLACLGWMIATRHRSHIRIRFFLDLMPGQPKRGTEIILQLGTAVLGGVIAWQGVHLLRVNADIEATTMPLSVAWMYLPVLPAGLITLSQGIADAWAQIKAPTAMTGIRTGKV
jgi:TRAP-type C4-dicarboxylate transport system permease small subunit